MSRFHKISVMILLLAAICVAAPTYGQSKKQLENEMSVWEDASMQYEEANA